ncbi:MAG: fibrobacter succinogenes major paralogous domain-containing protein [Dysgonamonadaceae bacterium]|jgi:hypothetical protein|nr:fibrobacter succinogenes major paralogous domain-containing protein [Dysgonamonadaceae bacterium]
MKMTKKMMFLFLLFPMVFGTVNGRAQVRIGGDAAPHTSAVLDLNATNNEATPGDLGLALPRVSLTGNDVPLNGATAATGTVVYNTNAAVTDGLDGKGLYVWDGTRWLFITSPNAYPIQKIDISIDENTAPTGKYAVCTNTWKIDTINRNVEIPLKVTATTTDGDTPTSYIAWSVSGVGAQITPDGKVSGNSSAMITVRATTFNGVFAEKWLVGRNSGVVDTLQIGAYRYATYDFDGIIWMLENLREEVPVTGQSFPYAGVENPTDADGNPLNTSGLYYNAVAAQSVCPSGWTLPTSSNVQALIAKYISSPGPRNESDLMTFGTDAPGFYSYTGDWSAGRRIWVMGNMGLSFGGYPWQFDTGNHGSYKMPVRCVRPAAK